MSHEVQAFDRSAFMSKIGLEPAEKEQESGNYLSGADQDALKRAASQPATGLTINAPDGTDGSDMPEYLKELLANKPEFTPVDWNAEFKALTGETLEEGRTVEADEVIRIAANRNAYQFYLDQNPQYKQFNEILNRTHDNDEARVQEDVELIKKELTTELGSRFSERRLAEYLKDFYEEGQLTDDGKRYAESIRAGMKTQRDAWEAKAKEDAAKYADTVIDARKTTGEFIDTFKPMGIDMPADDRAAVKEFVMSGQLMEKLSGQLTPEEQFFAAIVLNPYLRAKFSFYNYQRGGDELAKRKLASNLR